MEPRKALVKTLVVCLLVSLLIGFAAGCKSGSPARTSTSTASTPPVLKGVSWRINEETNEIEAVKDGKVVDLEELARPGQDISVEARPVETEGEKHVEEKAVEAVKALEAERTEKLKEVLVQGEKIAPAGAQVSAEETRAKKLKAIAEKYNKEAPENEEGAEEEVLPFLMGPQPDTGATAPEYLEVVRGTKSYKTIVEGGLVRLYYRLKYFPSRIARLANPAATTGIVVNVTQKAVADLTPSLNLIKSYLNTAAGSGESVVYYPDNDMIVVTTTEEKMKIIEEILTYIIDVPQPQVEISAIVSEITNSKDFQLGFRYSAIGKSDPTTTNVFERLTFNLPPKNFQDLFILPGSPVEQFQGGAFTLSSGTNKEGGRLDEFTLRALEDIEYAEIVSRPSSTVRVGQTARILVGEKVPIAQATLVNNVINISVKFEEVGVKLYITPLSISKDTVTLHVLVEVSAVLGFIDVSPDFPRQPDIQRNFAETTVRVRDGTRLLIGGLTATDEINRVIKIPFLGDIPYLGALFRSTQKANSKKELMFLITPRIEPPSEVFPEGVE